MAHNYVGHKPQPISRGLIDDLIAKYPGRCGREALQGTGLKYGTVNARCQELYSKSFETLREEALAADNASKGKGRWYTSRFYGGRNIDGGGTLNFA